MIYVRPPIELLKSVATERNADIALDVYCSDNVLLREFFWLRLWFLIVLIRRHARRGGICLDFGGGSGVFLASLVTMFHAVHLLDRNAIEARRLIERMAIANVTIAEEDVGQFEYAPATFDAVIAADVLEHFLDQDMPLAKIRRWLKPDGVLFTSLPSENIWYRLLRLIFRKTKPVDHYYAAHQVEANLRAAGFQKIAALYHPLFLPLFPLFRIGAWRKTHG
jgi:2-polyprenyl-3-methyl-5-hydroxy-6-metoxy-1,4-benzoquinol methylase